MEGAGDRKALSGRDCPDPTGEVLDLLGRRLYGMRDADRLLRVSPGTVRRWLEGGRIGQPPLIRPEPTGEGLVTWGEFVEARLLCEYRQRGVPMFRMRPAIQKLREIFDSRHPLAQARPFLDIEGRDLVMQAQEETGLDPKLWFVVRTGQLILPSPAVSRFDRCVERDDSIVRRIHMTDHVVLDPEYSAGALTIKGRRLRVDAIASAVAAGETPEDVADMCDISTTAVHEALSYADIA